jgi:hypothetical protein
VKQVPERRDPTSVAYRDDSIEFGFLSDFNEEIKEPVGLADCRALSEVMNLAFPIPSLVHDFLGDAGCTKSTKRFQTTVEVKSHLGGMSLIAYPFCQRVLRSSLEDCLQLSTQCGVAPGTNVI